MIEYRTGDIFNQEDVTIICHQANLYHTFGAGIARLIKEKYPEAYEADLKTIKGDEGKLGTYSIGKGKNGKFIANVYSQIGIGGDTRNTRYDHVADAFATLEWTLSNAIKKNHVVAIPYGYGSVLGGGKWSIVEAIIKSVFDKSPVKVVICRLPNQTDLQ